MGVPQFRIHSVPTMQPPRKTCRMLATLVAAGSLSGQAALAMEGSDKVPVLPARAVLAAQRPAVSLTMPRAAVLMVARSPDSSKSVRASSGARRSLR